MGQHYAGRHDRCKKKIKITLSLSTDTEDLQCYAIIPERKNMSKQQQKEQKKKNRERAAKQKVLQRREELRKTRKEAREQELAEKEAHEVVHGKMMPHVNVPGEREAAKAAIVAEKLKKNLEILQALEDEYEEEQKKRGEMNAHLEAEGHKTMREKMDALHKKALEMSNKADVLADNAEAIAADNTENPKTSSFS